VGLQTPRAFPARKPRMLPQSRAASESRRGPAAAWVHLRRSGSDSRRHPLAADLALAHRGQRDAHDGHCAAVARVLVIEGAAVKGEKPASRIDTEPRSRDRAGVGCAKKAAAYLAAIARGNANPPIAHLDDEGCPFFAAHYRDLAVGGRIFERIVDEIG